jgi:hypothetical protein
MCVAMRADGLVMFQWDDMLMIVSESLRICWLLLVVQLVVEVLRFCERKILFLIKNQAKCG